MEQVYKPEKVTIITVVYNAVNTIEDTIKSVINQTYKNIEYIIVDGGSTDGTLEIIEKYRSRIDSFISEPDKGIGDGFNKGISMASGEWIGMINADDWYATDAVDNIMHGVSKDDYVCCGNIRLIGGNGAERDKKSKVSWLNFGMYIMHPSCFVRNCVYRQVGKYDISLKIAMDFDMFLRIKGYGYHIRYVDMMVAYMRMGGVSNNTVKMHREELKVMRRHLHGFDYLLSSLFNYLNRLRWRYFYKDPLREPINLQA
jgi:glycosyltransferase involved in cell wall biosynthesis